MSVHTTVKCDICGEAAKHQKKRVQVVFLTEQTEGRYTTPHLSDETLDLCEPCLQRLVDSHPLTGTGAQGYNKYTWREKP